MTAKELVTQLDEINVTIQEIIQQHAQMEANMQNLCVEQQSNFAKLLYAMNVCLDKLNIVAKVDNAEVTMNDKFMPNSTHLLPMINTNKVTLVAMVDTNNSKILSSESKIEALIITEMTLKAG